MKHLSPLQAIRQKCLDCSGYSPQEVRLCACADCHLYPFRLGTNPNRKGIGGFTVASPVELAVEPGKNQEKEPLK